MTLHVLHVVDRLGVGGAERMLVDLANQAVTDGLHVSVCITRTGGELVRELRPDIEVLVLGRLNRFDWSALRRFGAFTRKQAVDVLHVHGRSSFALVAFCTATGICSAPVLLHDHRGIDMDSSVPGWFRLAGRLFLDQYVGVYGRLEEWARSAGLPSQRVHVIGNAIDLGRLTVDDLVGPSERPLRSGPLLGVSVGGLREEKGTDTLLEAVSRVHPELDFRVSIVGGAADRGYAQRCSELCSRLGIEQRISFLGMRQDVPALLRAADFGVMPSRSESGPLVLIEFMALGLPFVSTRVGDVSATAERLGVGEFVPPDDPARLAIALERLLRLPPEQRRSHGARGLLVAQRHFDVRAVGSKWYRLYDQMVRR